MLVFPIPWFLKKGEITTKGVPTIDEISMLPYWVIDNYAYLPQAAGKRRHWLHTQYGIKSMGNNQDSGFIITRITRYEALDVREMCAYSLTRFVNANNFRATESHNLTENSSRCFLMQRENLETYILQSSFELHLNVIYIGTLAAATVLLTLQHHFLSKWSRSRQPMSISIQAVPSQ